MQAFWRLVAFLVAAFYILVPLAAFAQSASSTTVVYQTPTCVMGANPSVIAPGGATTLTWGSAYATGGTITGVGSVNPSGSIQLLPPSASQTTFTGTFTGPGGTAHCSATVQVSTTVPAGGSASTGSTGNPVDVGSATSITNTGASAPVTPVTSAPLASPPQSPNGGLVPCGFSNGQLQNGVDTGATSCQACNLVQLVQNIINFAIGLSIPIAAGLFAYAGVVLFFAGEVAERRNKAKEIFRNAFIGFLIAISAWLVINTVLHTLLAGSTTIQQGSWFTISCVGTGSGAGNRQISGSINTLINSVLPGVNTTPGNQSTGNFNSNFNAAASSFTPSCSGSGYELTNDESGNQACYNTDTGDYQPPVYGSSPALSNSQMGQQIATACSQYGLDSTACSLASSIAGNESSGGKNCTTSPTGAAGCMQVLATTACGLDSSISDSCGACLSSHQSLSASCAPVIQTISGNTQLGTNLGVQYINQMYNQYNGSCQLAAAAYFQGPLKVQQAGGVPANAVNYVNKACGN